MSSVDRLIAYQTMMAARDLAKAQAEAQAKREGKPPKKERWNERIVRKLERLL